MRSKEKFRISTSKRSVRPEEAADLYVELGWGTRKDYSRTKMARALRDSHMIVSARNSVGELVGLARVLSDSGMYAKILDMIVDSDYKRQGAGRLMMEAILRKYKNTDIYCETEKNNFPFVLKFGFKKRKGLAVFVKERRL